MRILGIDPGYAIVGCGIIDYDSHFFKTLEYGAITTPADMNFESRLTVIYDQLTELISIYHPDAVAVERLYFNSNQKTAIDVAQARGVVLLASNKAGIPVYEYTPLQVKQSVVGYGRAEKKQVIDMVTQLLNLKKVPKPDDVADALAIAVCHAHSAPSRLNYQSLLRQAEKQEKPL